MGTSLLYGLIVIYFLVLLLAALFVLARPDSPGGTGISSSSQQRQNSQNQQGRQNQPARSPVNMKNSLAYGILAALLAFFLVLTVIVQRNSTHPSS